MILDFPAPGDVLRTVLDAVSKGLDAAPALMLGLAVLLVVPLLAVVGRIVVKRARRAPQRPFGTEPTDGPTRAWRRGAPQALLSFGDGPPRRITPTNPLVRIGRQDDNDIRIEAEGVHRYHALVHRGDDGRYWLLDVSGPGGNGVRVDGAPAERRRLRGGETIEVGGARLRFSLAGRAREEHA